MTDPSVSLTGAEWRVMECLWESAPRTGREIAVWLGEKEGWSRSTSLTLLRRLEAKGAVLSQQGDSGEVKTFRPLIQREAVALEETESLLQRAYRGSLSLLVSALTQKQTLPQNEIDELYAILHELEAKCDE